MKRETVTTALLAIAMLLVGSVAWGLALRPRLVVDARSLDTLPIRIGSWSSQDVPLEATVESILQADYNIQRRYQHALGDVVWLYFGYYGTERGGTVEHTPPVCFKAHGWQIEDSEHIEVAGDFRVNEMVVSLGAETQLVHYWYRSYRKTGLLGGFEQTIDRLLGRLLHDRADGSLVRVSTGIVNGDREGARSRLLAFDTAVDEQLAAHWPRETPESWKGGGTDLVNRAQP